mmetsp:Transcript_5104/g.18327  ORF Transcript_5104/g.18327 Transcript_5104/m.18327 type:complete len:258 (-) Transcript_5104:314-1087(-)
MFTLMQPDPQRFSFRHLHFACSSPCPIENLLQACPSRQPCPPRPLGLHARDMNHCARPVPPALQKQQGAVVLVVHVLRVKFAELWDLFQIPDLHSRHIADPPILVLDLHILTLVVGAERIPARGAGLRQADVGQGRRQGGQAIVPVKITSIAVIRETGFFRASHSALPPLLPYLRLFLDRAIPVQPLDLRGVKVGVDFLVEGIVVHGWFSAVPRRGRELNQEVLLHFLIVESKKMVWKGILPNARILNDLSCLSRSF